MDHQRGGSTSSLAHAILAHMPVAVAVYDPQELRLLEANRLFLMIMERFLDPVWHQGRIIGIPLTDWAPPAVMPGLLSKFRAVAETGLSYQVCDFAFPNASGSITYWNWTLQRMEAGDGQGFHLLQTISEVTAQVLARQEAERVQTSLRQETHLVEADRQRLAVIETLARSVCEAVDTESIGRTAIEAISAAIDPLSICIYTADPLQQILRLLHLRPRTGSKETFLTSIPYDNSPLVAHVHTRQDPILIEDLQVAAASGVVPNMHPLVIRGVRGYICVPLWFKDRFEGTLAALFTHPLSWRGTEVQTLAGCASHIAAALAHARLQWEIEQNQARLRAIFDQLPEGVFLVEVADGCISYANPAAASIIGVPLTVLLGAPLAPLHQAFSITDLDGRPIPSEQFITIRALHGETVNGKEEIIIMPDGRQMILLSSAAPLLTEQGEITGAVAIFQDITERKSLEQQKNHFLSLASHELRTPIAAIQGLAEILQQLSASGESLDTPRSIRAIKSIAGQSQRQVRLIEEMLDLSRLDQAQLQLHLAPHDLLKTLMQVIESQAVTTKEHNMRLVLEGLQGSEALIGCFDEERLVQVLSNLISNAIKYSPRGGEIEIGVQQTPEQPDEVLIWVRDHGMGIAADALSRIFERFYRSDQLGRGIAGLGIGLYLVKEFVTRHGGRVWAESSEGVGSTFYVRLPLSNGHE